jgi:hypothetical protein
VVADGGCVVADGTGGEQKAESRKQKCRDRNGGVKSRDQRSEVRGQTAAGAARGDARPTAGE